MSDLAYTFNSFLDATAFIKTRNENSGPYDDDYLAACDYIALPEESARNLK